MEEKHNNIARITAEHLSEHVNTPVKDISDLSHKILSAKSVDEIKKAVVDINPNANTDKIHKAANALIKAKEHNHHEGLYKVFATLSLLIGIAFSASIGTIWPVLLGGMIASYFGMESGGKDNYAEYLGGDKDDIATNFQSTIKYNNQTFWQNFKDEMLS
ncbi:MAG: hypothetical protein NTY74_16270 [Ignavibacteriae bacterium]|nr:hypothetical protein [Ignavibacteriota bacterium]